MKNNRKSAIVFAYHDVGVRCLKVLLDGNVDVKLVVTHQNSPTEKIWFESVAKTAAEYQLKVETPENPNTLEYINKLRELEVDFIFSFYYRFMLSPDILSAAKENCFNMHGSMLPKYRGRVPLNWAIIHGETDSGATLHVMTAKADAGDIVDQFSVPILRDDTGVEVFKKMVVAAEIVLHRCLPAIIDLKYPLKPNAIKEGSYFGGRKPADGLIKPESMSTKQIHNLVRAVAPPYPGAFLLTEKSEKFFIYRTLLQACSSTSWQGTKIYAEKQRYYFQQTAYERLEILECSMGENDLQTANDFFQLNNDLQLPWKIL